ncbi:CTK1, partial [Symbiodinium natans]
LTEEESTHDEFGSSVVYVPCMTSISAQTAAQLSEAPVRLKLLITEGSFVADAEAREVLKQRVRALRPAKTVLVGAQSSAQMDQVYKELQEEGLDVSCAYTGLLAAAADPARNAHTLSDVGNLPKLASGKKAIYLPHVAGVDVGGILRLTEAVPGLELLIAKPGSDPKTWEILKQVIGTLRPRKTVLLGVKKSDQMDEDFRELAAQGLDVCVADGGPCQPSLPDNFGEDSAPVAQWDAGKGASERRASVLSALRDFPRQLSTDMPRQLSLEDGPWLASSQGPWLTSSHTSLMSAIRMSYLLTLIDAVKSEMAPSTGVGAHWKALLLLSVPVTGCLTGFGVQLARSRSSFSLYLPLALSAAILLAGLLARLALGFGRTEFRKLASRKYLWCVGPAIFVAVRYGLQNLAVSMMSSSLFFIIMRMTLIWVALFEALMLRQLPGKLQTVTLMAILLSCISSTVQALEEEDTEASGSMLAIALAVACGFSDAVCDTCYAMLERNFARELLGREKSAELCRIMVMLQAFSLPCYVLMLVWFDSDDAFSGFDMTTFALTVVPVALKVPLFQ